MGCVSVCVGCVGCECVLCVCVGGLYECECVCVGCMSVSVCVWVVCVCECGYVCALWDVVTAHTHTRCTIDCYVSILRC